MKSQLDFMREEEIKLKETIVKLSIDSNELKTMKKRNQLSLLEG